MKTAPFALFTAVIMFAVSPAFAGNKNGDDHSCCATTASHSDAACLDYASLDLNAKQKSKIEAWQAECTKAGCTKESRETFLNRAKKILSPEQYAKLEQQCKAKTGAKSRA
jgi:hypothetical protein